MVGDKKIPLVLYLHGCAGFDWHTNHDISFLLRNGYAVLAPNSNARKYRPTSCDPMTLVGGLFRGILAFRLAEAGHAHEAAKNLAWVDKANIFMMGFSEGGITAAQYDRGGLAGRIILGWTCNAGWPEYNGILAQRMNQSLQSFHPTILGIRAFRYQAIVADGRDSGVMRSRSLSIVSSTTCRVFQRCKGKSSSSLKTTNDNADNDTNGQMLFPWCFVAAGDPTHC